MRFDLTAILRLANDRSTIVVGEVGLIAAAPGVQWNRHCERGQERESDFSHRMFFPSAAFGCAPDVPQYG